MAWVTGIKEVKYVRVPTDAERRGPIKCVQVRTIADLPSCALGGTIRCGPTTYLPVHTGAGPCGTLARRSESGARWWPACDPARYTPRGCYQPYPARDVASPLAWSIKHLIQPLRRHYATHIEPMHFGAKSGPRGRQAA